MTSYPKKASYTVNCENASTTNIDGNIDTSRPDMSMCRLNAVFSLGAHDKDHIYRAEWGKGLE